jgi:hypothetical protein
MTKSDITDILTQLAVMQQQMKSVESRVKRLEQLVIWAFGIYTTATIGAIYSGVI